MFLKKLIDSYFPECREELSDLVTVEAVVVKKHEIHDYSLAILGIIYNNYKTVFGANEFTMPVSNLSVFEKFEEGDKILLSYQDVFCVIYKYAPPDYKKKKPVSREFSYRNFKNAKKL